MGRNKGITLIALVITIIVLLILAAVSIATLTGENGILTQANKAKNQTVIAREKEEINLAYISAQSKKNIITAEDLNDEFNNDGIEAQATDVEEGKIKVTFSKTGNEYEINENGEITGPNIGATIKVISGTEGENSWYTSDVEISIKNNGGTKNRVTYELTGETQQTEKEITNEEVIRISNEGITEIIARSYDENNDIQTSRMQIKKDSIAPTIEKPEDIIVDVNINVDENFIKEKNTIRDNLTEVRISDIQAKTSSGDGTEITLTGYDIYTISYNIKDEAGNTTEVEQSVTTKPTEAITLTNIIPDPSFEDGSIEGWGNAVCFIADNESETKTGNHALKCVTNEIGINAFPRKNFGNLDIANKNIYVSSYHFSHQLGYTIMYVYSASTDDLWKTEQEGDWVDDDELDQCNKWKQLSIILTTKSTIYDNFIIQFGMGKDTEIYTVWWDDLLGVDLAPFGEKVPTKNWLDKMVTYFEGTKTFNW